MNTSSRSLAFNRFVLATLTVLLLLPALPAAASDRDTCQSASGDVAIDGCSRAIATGSFRGQSLAQLYQWRGHQFLKKVQLEKNEYELERAIADFSEAIAIDPETVGCFTCRCAARLLAGQFVEALEDCNQALRRKPNYGAALQNRGFVNIKLELFDFAIDDFNAGLKLSPTDPEMLYGRGLARQKKGDKAGGDSDIAAARGIKPDIANAIGKFYGQI
jgi:tetratricopeptide (TPR) repeat protein